MRLALLGALVMAACGGTDGDAVDAAIGDVADSIYPDAGVDAAMPCVRTPRPADAPRRVVIGKPYTDAGDPSDDYEIYELDSSGNLVATGVSFTMGRAFDGTIAFTPDGKLGFSVQDDGTVGIFRLEDNGSVTVIDTGYDAGGEIYATGVVMSPLGDKAYVLNGQWRENGGGVYGLTIHCDDTIRYDGLIAPAKLPYGMHFVPGGDTAVVVADDILTSGWGGAHLVAWSSAPELLASADIFGDDESIVAGSAITADGQYVLAGDNSAFSGIPNRIAIAGVGATTLTPVDVLTPIEDPVAIVASPDNDAVLVVSGFGDALFELDYDPANTTTPFTLVGELSYTGGGPQLPSGAVMIGRGALRGRVLIAENTAIRQVQFESGSIVDLGGTSTGGGLASIVGTIGVQP